MLAGLVYVNLLIPRHPAIFGPWPFVSDLRTGAIIHALDLRRPIYRQTAAYGHFGREDLDLPWERLDRVDELRAAAG